MRVSSAYCPCHLIVFALNPPNNSFATASLKIELGEKTSVHLLICLFIFNSILEIQVSLLDIKCDNMNFKIERMEERKKE